MLLMQQLEHRLYGDVQGATVLKQHCKRDQQLPTSYEPRAVKQPSPIPACSSVNLPANAFWGTEYRHMHVSAAALLAYLLKCILRHRVQAHDWLVGLLDNQVFALIQLEAEVNDSPDNAPAVLHVQVDLHGKVLGLAHLQVRSHIDCF